jgi:hypothetical protein
LNSTGHLDKVEFVNQTESRREAQCCPTATNPSDIAEQMGKSRQTVYDYFDELEAAGKLHRNGSINVVIWLGSNDSKTALALSTPARFFVGQ